MLNPVLDRFIERLTDNYDKAPNGNVHKLAQLTVAALQEQEDVLQRLDDWNDVDQAQGTTLDMHGRDILQDRGQASDEVYRVLIKSKILRLLSDGSIDVIIDFLAFILDCNVTDLRVKELWPEGKTATLDITAPAGPINRTGLSARQFGTLVNLVIAGGVRAEAFFEGTFRFSSQLTVPETSDHGFSNLEQTSGGTLGLLYNPDTDYELPI